MCSLWLDGGAEKHWSWFFLARRSNSLHDSLLVSFRRGGLLPRAALPDAIQEAVAQQRLAMLVHAGEPHRREPVHRLQQSVREARALSLVARAEHLHHHRD